MVFLSDISTEVTTSSFSRTLLYRMLPCWGAWDADKDLENWRGCMTDMRIYKGVAKYTGGFDVPNPYAPENSSTNYGIETWRTGS